MMGVNKMIVKNMISNRSGKPIANQFIITINGLIIFQSYVSVIAVTRWNKENVILDETHYNYSRTTSKYLYRFLNFGKDEIDLRLASGSLRFANLNNTDNLYNESSFDEYKKFISLYDYNVALHDAVMSKKTVAVS